MKEFSLSIMMSGGKGGIELLGSASEKQSSDKSSDPFLWLNGRRKRRNQIQ